MSYYVQMEEMWGDNQIRCIVGGVRSPHRSSKAETKQDAVHKKEH